MKAGRATPLPDYVSIAIDAKHWGVTPMEIREWPLYWVEVGRIMREAESIAQSKQKK